MGWYTCDFTLCDQNDKSPVMVFGTDLHDSKNLKAAIGHDKLQAHLEKHGNITFQGTTYWTLKSNKGGNERNMSYAGTTGRTKPILNKLINSFNEFNENENVDQNFIKVVAKASQLVNWAQNIARAFPTFNPGTNNGFPKENRSVPKHRDLKIQFIATDADSKNFNHQDDGQKLLNIMKHLRRANELNDTPPSHMSVRDYFDDAKKCAENLKSAGYNVSFEGILGEDVKKRGFGGVYGVGAGNGPNTDLACIAILKLDNSANGVKKHIGIVGKAVVYDAGGYQIKSHGGMTGMKQDKGGSMNMLAAFQCLVEFGFNQNLTLFLPFVENLVDNQSYKPDDILNMKSGLTVEINHTDCEGRLCLADGVSYLSNELMCDYVFDVATLTGALGTTVGVYHGGVYTNCEKLEKRVVEIGKKTADLIYPLIYAPELHMKNFISTTADMTNCVSNRMNAGSGSAGAFVGSHLKDGFDFKGIWCHIDMSTVINDNFELYKRSPGWGVGFFQKLMYDMGWLDQKSSILE